MTSDTMRFPTPDVVPSHHRSIYSIGRFPNAPRINRDELMLRYAEGSKSAAADEFPGLAAAFRQALIAESGTRPGGSR